MDEEQKMVSFDNVTLFPSIDISEINQIVNEEIESLYHDREVKRVPLKRRSLIIIGNYFRFNNIIFK